MAEKNDLIIEKIKSLVTALEEIGIHIQEAYLFGSFAQGNTSAYSDIDVALMSDSFTGIRLLDIKKMGRIPRTIDLRFETHTFTPQDRTESFFYQEILKTGIRVA